MCSNRKLPLIIAHRGTSVDAPENTLAAFKGAVSHSGIDGIEFDVRLAKDGIPVVFHDATLQRIARRKELVSSFTSAELQHFDIGAWFNRSRPSKANPDFIGEPIPTLKQVFDFLKNYKGRIYVELKGFGGEMPLLVQLVVEVIRQTNLLSNIVLKSFNLEAVHHAKKLFPELRTAALLAPKITPILRRESRLIERAKACTADELSLHYTLATPKMLAAAIAEKLPVTIWTVNRQSWVKRAAEIGVEAIITNYPAWLAAARDESFREN